MYLLLVDHNLISTTDLKEMIEQSPEGTDIVNCYSQETLLKLADKISPDIIIIDFDLVKGNLADLFGSLRSKSLNAYVMALISSEYYDTLFNAIELGGIDDYMVKPVQKEDLLARVQIASKKKQRLYKDDRETYSLDTEEKDGFEDMEEEVGYQFAEQPETLEQESEPDQFAEDKDLSPQDENIMHYQGITEEDLLDSGEKDQAGPDVFSESGTDQEELSPEDLDLEPGPAESSDKPEEAKDIFNDLDIFDDKSEESPAEEKEPGPGSGFDFDDIIPGSDKQEYGGEDLGEDFTPGTQAPEPDPFEDTGKFDQEPDQTDTTSKEDDKEDLLQLFEDVDNIFDTESDVGPSTEDVQTGSEWEPFAAKQEEDPQPGPDVVRPADEFIAQTKAPDSKEPTSPLAEDKKFFDDLFDDDSTPEDSDKKADDTAWDPGPAKGTQNRENRDIFQQDQGVTNEDFAEEDRSNLYSKGPQRSREEIRRRSDLPGRTADEFLFGEDSEAEQDSQEPGSGETDSGRYFTEEDWEEQEEENRSKKQKKSRGKFRKFLSIFGNILFVVLLLVMAGLSFFLIQSRVTGGVPQVAGYQMYIVLSGSMAPEFDTGSLAFVREVEPAELVVGDIITFRSPNDPDSLTTHRIVEIQREDGLSFITRGDANNVNDPNPVPAENVVGMVTGAVPYVGYLLNFVQTTQGLVLLIFVPGVLIIVFELNKILKYLTQGENGGKRKKDNSYNRLAEDKQ